jgi:hypothetical protein
MNASATHLRLSRPHSFDCLSLCLQTQIICQDFDNESDWSQVIWTLRLAFGLIYITPLRTHCNNISLSILLSSTSALRLLQY